ATESLPADQASITSVDGDSVGPLTSERPEHTPLPPFAPSTLVSNGDHGERPEHTPSIEGGRRTARGEFFRRPPQPPAQLPPVASTASGSLQAPTHEIALPLGNLLHLA